MIRKIHKANFIKYTSIIVLCIGVLGTLYFSWINSPRLSYNKYMPNFVAKWADMEVNYNIRTAIPLLVVGLCTGLILVVYKKSSYSWFLSWLVLTALVFVAELGQLFLPLRSFDLGDVIWGAFGAGFGLLLVLIGKFLSKKIKHFLYE